MSLRTIVPSQLTPPLAITYITSDDQLGQLDEFLSSITEVGLDVETNMVEDFYYRRIRTIQLGNKDRQYVIDTLPFIERARAGTTLSIEDAYMQFMGNCKYHPVFDTLVRILRKHLETTRLLKIGHSLQFEYQTFKWCFGIRIFGLFCTFLAEKVIRAGSIPFFKKVWGLHHLVAKYTATHEDMEDCDGYELVKDEQKGFNLSGALTESQLVYAALDSRVPLIVRLRQMKHILANKLERAVQLEFDALPAFGDIFLNGILFDVKAWLGLVAEVKNRHEVYLEVLDKYFIPYVGEKQITQFDVDALHTAWKSLPGKVIKGDPIAELERKATREAAKKAYELANRTVKIDTKNFNEKFEGKAAINYGSSRQLLPVLWKMGFSPKELKSTDERVLGNFSSRPVIKALLDYRETSKLLSTYGEKFASDVRIWWSATKDGKPKKNREGSVHPITRRIHSDLVQIGAETGRTSSKEPNLQNLPKLKEWRACFLAPAGSKMLTIDMNGCELRILTEYSGEPKWVDAFNKDWDVHSVGAEIIFGSMWLGGAVKDGLCADKPALDEDGKPYPDCAYYYKDHKKCKCPIHNKLRDQIKAINFGIAYGMSKFKLADTLKITVDEAAILLNRYQTAFPTLVAYLITCGADARNDRVSRTLSGRWRKYLSPLQFVDPYEYVSEREFPDDKEWDKEWERVRKEKGLFDIREKILERRKKAGNSNKLVTIKDVAKERQIMFGSIDREGKNTPIQGSNADIMKVAMGAGYGSDGLPFMWQRLETDFKAKLVNFVHDEFVVECPDEYAEECYKFVSECMSRAGAEFVKKIPMTTDGVIDTKWAKG